METIIYLIFGLTFLLFISIMMMPRHGCGCGCGACPYCSGNIDEDYSSKTIRRTAKAGAQSAKSTGHSKKVYID